MYFFPICTRQARSDWTSRALEGKHFKGGDSAVRADPGLTRSPARQQGHSVSLRSSAASCAVVKKTHANAHEFCFQSGPTSTAEPLFRGVSSPAFIISRSALLSIGHKVKKITSCVTYQGPWAGTIRTALQSLSLSIGPRCKTAAGAVTRKRISRWCSRWCWSRCRSASRSKGRWERWRSA